MWPRAVMIGLAGAGLPGVIRRARPYDAVFTRAGRERAFVLGLMASQRSKGLMLAATGGLLPDLVWLYFALCQFPIYLSPQLLKPLARRLVASHVTPTPAGTPRGYCMLLLWPSGGRQRWRSEHER